MIFQLIDESTGILLDAVQNFFGTHTLASSWRWNPNDDVSKVIITDRFPDTAHGRPTIIIKGSHGDSISTGFRHMAGPLLDSGGDLVGEALKGWYTANITWLVESERDADAKRVADILFLALMHFLVESIMKASDGGMWANQPFVRGISEADRNLTDGTKVYTKTMVQQYTLEWRDERLLEPTVSSFEQQVTILDC